MQNIELVYQPGQRFILRVRVGKTITNIELSPMKVQELHNKLSINCVDDNCPCVQRGYEWAQETVGEWNKPSRA